MSARLNELNQRKAQLMTELSEVRKQIADEKKAVTSPKELCAGTVRSGRRKGKQCRRFARDGQFCEVHRPGAQRAKPRRIYAWQGCMAVTKKGTACTNYAGSDGYCSTHWGLLHHDIETEFEYNSEGVPISIARRWCTTCDTDLTGLNPYRSYDHPCPAKEGAREAHRKRLAELGVISLLAVASERQEAGSGERAD